MPNVSSTNKFNTTHQHLVIFCFLFTKSHTTLSPSLTLFAWCPNLKLEPTHLSLLSPLCPSSPSPAPQALVAPSSSSPLKLWSPPQARRCLKLCRPLKLVTASSSVAALSSSPPQAHVAASSSSPPRALVAASSSRRRFKFVSSPSCFGHQRFLGPESGFRVSASARVFHQRLLRLSAYVVVDLDYNRITTSEEIPPIPEPEYRFLRGEVLLRIQELECSKIIHLELKGTNAYSKVDSTVKHKQNFDRFLISQKPLSNVNTSAKKRDHCYSLAEDFLEITPRKTIGELKECKEDGDYAVYGTIMGVIGGLDWFVAQCRCGIEVVLKLGSYYCEKSSKHVDLFSLKL
ncbi:hypothetical protein Ahy_B07g087896 isoform B [Arachis hypogaea]|uniref:Uncharacterized protein n=1 Tax=Arachis hypogaea TaxID=3818 RepID=A0A444YD84_ARAHY|nr:hypothetical protein Ahy_B07g087896 isoform B [Arachis hypogaea]